MQKRIVIKEHKLQNAETIEENMEMSMDYIPQTELGKKLWEIKKKMILKGETINDWKNIVSIIREGRA